MKIFIVIILFFVTLSAKNGYNYYYYGSQSKLNKTAIVKIATQQIRRLAIKNKIPKSWKFLTYSNIKKVKKSSASDWVVDFYNSKIKNKNKRTLYIFVNINGDVKGVNYSGH